ncbi:MAG TPA: carbon starvation protein A [Gemmatimonadaceae bacterium]|nr:carbon starvation protein A [Gemmatimonadaceae bacterium]
MSAIFLMAAGLGAFILGYLVYSKYISERVFRLDPGFRTPAHAQEDGIDFVPTNRFVLWGHHFTSVAGAAPIVGPAIAVVWGWLPAFLWVVLGTVFFAGVHDAGALWASVRNRGQSIGALTESVVGKRARSLFMIVIFLLLLMVNAVFAIVIANLFVSFPSSVIPSWFVIVVALGIGYSLYRRGVPLFWPSAIGLVLLYASMFVGDVIPVSLPGELLGLGVPAQWVLLLFAYAAIASLLPVWMLLQPRDYINGLQLFTALGIFFVAVLLANPGIVAPAINAARPADVPPIIPLLFVTIACGAISGFHGLVSSGTTSKQVDNERDVRLIGFLGATGEGALALAAIIACTAGFASLGEWQAFYSSFAAGGTSAFVQGGGAIITSGLGFPAHLGQTMLAVMAVLFAATTMDTGVRLQRYIIQEWGSIYEVPALTKRGLATLIAVGSCVALAFGAGGGAGTGGLIIWPLFGTTNQLLAALTLLVLSVYLLKMKRPTVYTLVPFIFLIVMTILALLVQLRGFWERSQYFLVFVDILILVATIWVALESLGALRRARTQGGSGGVAAPPGAGAGPGAGTGPGAATGTGR